VSESLDVVGIGSMVVDRVHRCARILGPDQKGILEDRLGAGAVREFAGGVVLNHLAWAAALGLRAGIFGRQADDPAGRLLRSAMEAAGIEYDIAIVGAIVGETEAESSSVAEIFIDERGDRTIYMAPGTTAGTTAEQVRTAHADFIRRAGRLTTEVSQLPLAATLAALQIAREAGIPTVVDLDVPPSDALATLGDAETLDQVLRSADLLKPSKAAAAELVPEAGGDALEIAHCLRERFGNGVVVVTDGAAGCAISALDFAGSVAGVRAKEIVDTTGAGDAFLAGLLVGLRHEIGWEDAARLANACGAACVEQLGAFPGDPELARLRVLELYAGRSFELGDSAGVAKAQHPHPAAAGLAVLECGAREIEDLRRRHDGAAFMAAAELIEAAEGGGGRVHVTGVGKAEHVAHYAASLLSSTGIPAAFLHSTEAMHGSLGQVVAGDVVIAISNSGATEELGQVVACLEGFDAPVVAVTGGLESRLARTASVVLDAAVTREGGPLNLAPRASVAAEILVIAALGAVLQERRNFGRDDYVRCHPAGELGRRAREE